MAIIDKPSDYFRTKLYAGNATNNRAITWDETNTNMQADLLWFKSRTDTQTHGIWDSVRGAIKRLIPSSTGAEGDEANDLDSFDTNGFTVDSAANMNGSSRNYVTWGWKAGTSFTNDASATGIGTIDSTGSVNTDAGFSIVKLDTGTSGNISFGHGLGVAPKVVIIKTTSGGGNWIVGHDSIGWGKYLNLNNTNAEASDSTVWQNTAPTSSVVTTNSTFIYNTGSTIVAYCFVEKSGYSSMGQYTGNGNADGTFIYTGFKPALIMCKKYNVGGNWIMFDNKREPFNLNNDFLQADLSDAEVTGNATIRCDFVSNGVKLRGTNNAINTSGGSYIYIAIGEEALVTNVANGSIPNTAR